MNYYILTDNVFKEFARNASEGKLAEIARKRPVSFLKKWAITRTTKGPFLGHQGNMSMQYVRTVSIIFLRIFTCAT